MDAVTEFKCVLILVIIIVISAIAIVAILKVLKEAPVINFPEDTKKIEEELIKMGISRVDSKKLGLTQDNTNKRAQQPAVDMDALEADNKGIPLYDHDAPIRLKGIKQQTGPNATSTQNHQPTGISSNDNMTEETMVRIQRATPLVITKPGEEVLVEIDSSSVNGESAQQTSPTDQNNQNEISRETTDGVKSGGLKAEGISLDTTVPSSNINMTLNFLHTFADILDQNKLGPGKDIVCALFEAAMKVDPNCVKRIQSNDSYLYGILVNDPTGNEDTATINVIDGFSDFSDKLRYQKIADELGLSISMVKRVARELDK